MTALTALAETPLSPEEQLSTVLLVSSYCRQWAMLTRDLGRGYLGPGASPDPTAEYQRTLAALVEPDRFPAVHAALAEGMLGDPSGDLASPPGPATEAEEIETEFAFGLDRILDGLAVHIDRRTG